MLPPKPIQPCLPRPAKEPPNGPGWIMRSSTTDSASWRIGMLKDGIKLYTRNGYDFEAIVVDANGLSVFDPLRYRLGDHAALLCAFRGLAGAASRPKTLGSHYFLFSRLAWRPFLYRRQASHVAGRRRSIVGILSRVVMKTVAARRAESQGIDDQDLHASVDERREFHSLISVVSDSGLFRAEGGDYQMAHQISKRRDKLAQLRQVLDRLLQHEPREGRDLAMTGAG